jgi:hypothetical protein
MRNYTSTAVGDSDPKWKQDWDQDACVSIEEKSWTFSGGVQTLYRILEPKVTRRWGV